MKRLSGERLMRRLWAAGATWNWKSALCSSIWRASVFFLTNLPAGIAAAAAASRTEFIYRAIAAGFYGSLTARFARSDRGRTATATALIVVPLVSHSIEYGVHWFAGTPYLTAAVSGSVLVTVVTTRFNLFAMRRGLLLVGPGDQSLTADGRQLTALAFAVPRRWIRRGVASNVEASD